MQLLLSVLVNQNLIKSFEAFDDFVVGFSVGFFEVTKDVNETE